MATAEVYLWKRLIGAVTDEGDGEIRFAYNPDFVNSKSGIELAPLAMPVSDRIYSFPELSDVKPYYGLPGMLADSLPDSFGNRMITEYLYNYGNGRSTLSPIEKLLYTGERGMGALEYVPSIVPANKCENINLQALTELAEKILTSRKLESFSANEDQYKQLLQVGSSAGGARAKALIALNEKTGEIRSGQVNAGEGYSYWLLKFDRMSANFDREIKPDDIDSTRVEYSYYLMSKAAGLDMQECRLLKDGDCAHFMTKRFDRIDGGKKLHMVTLCGMAHFNFRDRLVHSYEDIATVLDRLGLVKDIEKLFARMVFNDLTFNYDDHCKNTSFLMDQKGNWSLSPAYDIGFAFDSNGRYTNTHQMYINGKYENITTADYLEAGRRMGLKDAAMHEIITRAKDAVAKWETFAAESELREERMSAIKTLVDSKLE